MLQYSSRNMWSFVQYYNIILQYYFKSFVLDVVNFDNL